jgi:hypothetical protein
MIDQLPPDQFNVEVENDMDRARLLWLVNHVGEAKLRRSVAKYQVRWPKSRPFVSTLLKWYRLKVPVAVYAPVAIPVYWLYVLYKRDNSEIKVGVTGKWPVRVFAWVPLRKEVADIFDLDRSKAFLVGGSKKAALCKEKAIKTAFAGSRSRCARGWNDGYTEWFYSDCFDEVIAMATLLANDHGLVVQTLRAAFALRARKAQDDGPPFLLN